MAGCTRSAPPARRPGGGALRARYSARVSQPPSGDEAITGSHFARIMNGQAGGRAFRAVIWAFNRLASCEIACATMLAPHTAAAAAITPKSRQARPDDLIDCPTGYNTSVDPCWNNSERHGPACAGPRIICRGGLTGHHPAGPLSAPAAIATPSTAPTAANYPRLRAQREHRIKSAAPRRQLQLITPAVTPFT
jgi:hypothetical protein